MIYLDNAATTMTDPEVVRAMLPYFTENFGSPSSAYGMGNDVRHAIALAKEQIAHLIGARPNEIYFTSGGTEADNWAIMGSVLGVKHRPHVITTQIEHVAVLNSCRALERMGCEVTYLPVMRDGMVDPDKLKYALKPGTDLVSVMMANNEIGTIEPIEELAAIAHENGTLFHTDVAQCVGNIPLDVRQLDVDMMSASAHKFGGPKGVGFLYIRNGIDIRPYIYGGNQQNGMRAGTENVPGIVGLGAAAEIAGRNLDMRSKHIETLRDMLLNEIKDRVPGTTLNGSRKYRLPNNINVSFSGVDAQNLLVRLDMQGLCVSTGAEITSEPSHVLKAININESRKNGAIRISLSDKNTMGEIDKIADIIAQQVDMIRGMTY